MDLRTISEKLIKRISKPETQAADVMEIILSLVGTMSIELILDHRLSEQESECLYWLINGAKQNQIAQIMGISRETVKGYQSRILHKLEGRTITQAVYKKALSYSLKNDS